LRIRRTRPGRVRYAAGWVKGEGDPFGRVLAGRGWAVTRRRRASPAGMKFLEGFGLRGRDRRTAAGPPASGASLRPQGAKVAPSMRPPVHGPGTPRPPAPPNATLFSSGRAFPGIFPGAESGLEESARMGPPPMRAEARSRRPVSPIPGLPGKEGAGEADMRGEGSWSGEGIPGKAMLGAESVAFSFAPRLLPPPACLSPPLFPCSPPSSLPVFCARSVCLSYPFSLLLCFHGLASLFPGLLPVRPGFRAAIPGENPVRPGFSAWRNPALAVGDPGAFRCSIGLPDWPRGIRTAPGDGPRRDPGSESGATASRTNGSVSSSVSSVNSSVRSGRTGRGAEGEGRAGAPGLLRAAPNPSLLGEQYC
jgi:hypothetical protein